MELNQQQTEKPTPKKLSFKLSTKSKDGAVLQLHHTVQGRNKEKKRLRFTTAVFNHSGDHLACLDEKENLFILDFDAVLFWKFKDVGSARAMFFYPDNDEILLIGLILEDFPLIFLDINTGDIKNKLTGHQNEIKNLSMSRKRDFLMSASISEAIIWKTDSFEKFFTIDANQGSNIFDINFIPSTDLIASCYQNNAIHIWKAKSMKIIKQIIPNKIEMIKSVAFSQNGRMLVIAGNSSLITLFCLDSWKVLKLIDLSKYRISTVLQVDFIPQHYDGGANKILAVFTSNFALNVLDVENESLVYRLKKDNSIKRICISKNGKYLACIFEVGEVHIFNTSQMLNLGASGDICSIASMAPKKVMSNTSKNIQIEMKKTLDADKLKTILRLQGEYPDRYRNIIWGVLLSLPESKKAYGELAERPIHPNFENLEDKFNISSRKLFKILKKTLSSLTYWAPVFGLIDYLPYFIFPFVVTLHKYPFFLFEVLATVLINYCQLWFEFSPLPPINVLGMIENILGKRDSELLRHFYKAGVTSQEYALPLLITGFSEVLAKNQWLILWDHIFSNEPSYILMSVVAYNINQRTIIKSLTSKSDIKDFFHSQNPIDMKHFIKKAYFLLEDTNHEIHPRKCFKPFSPLFSGSSYQQFTGFPKTALCVKSSKNDKNKLNDIVEVISEHSIINKKMRNETGGRRKKLKKRSKNLSKVISTDDSSD